MSISIEYCCYSRLLFGRLLAQATLLFSLLLRWISFSPLNSWWPSSPSAEASARHSIAAQAVRDSLPVLTYGELIEEDQVASAIAGGDTTCAVCLSEVRRRDRVRELKNCMHVFHRGCLDRWLDHDEHLTCPLCRAPLLGGLPRLPCFAAAAAAEPSWAVERLLYLFGDDLVFASSSSSFS